MRISALVPALISLGALITGGAMFASPDGSLLGFPLTMLHGSPFHSFLIPGLILFAINGVGQAAVAWLVFRRHPAAGTVLQLGGLSLAIWIFVQVSMIGGGHWLQAAYFGLAVTELTLGWLLLVRRIPHA